MMPQWFSDARVGASANVVKAPAPQWAAMTEADLPELMSVEARAYAYPWSRGNFVDAIWNGHRCLVLRSPEGNHPILGYSVTLPGVDEAHLLNITVVPEFQGQGHARAMLAAVARDALRAGFECVWLEVRQSNQRARRLYERFGFVTVAERSGYYPSEGATREAAVVMRLALQPHEDGA